MSLPTKSANGKRKCSYNSSCRVFKNYRSFRTQITHFRLLCRQFIYIMHSSENIYYIWKTSAAYWRCDVCTYTRILHSISLSFSVCVCRLMRVFLVLICSDTVDFNEIIYSNATCDMRSFDFRLFASLSQAGFISYIIIKYSMIYSICVGNIY